MLAQLAKAVLSSLVKKDPALSLSVQEEHLIWLESAQAGLCAPHKTPLVRQGSVWGFLLPRDASVTGKTDSTFPSSSLHPCHRPVHEQV